MNSSTPNSTQRIFPAATRERSETLESAGSIGFDYEANFRQSVTSPTTAIDGHISSEAGSSSNCWMESVWAPPNLLNIITSGELDQPSLVDDFAPVHHHHQKLQQHSGSSTNSNGTTNNYCCPTTALFQTVEHQPQQHSRPLKRPSPIRQQQQQFLRHSSESSDYFEQLQEIGSVTNNDSHCPPKPRLIVLRQPEEQHRARYASEGSRGAIKDRSGTSYCSIQLVGYYRPTRVELFAAEQNPEDGTFVQHSQYKLIPVAGKSSTMTPCKRITADDGSERLEIVLRPENRMIGILDCIGIMKICSYGITEGKRPTKRRKQNAREDNGGKDGNTSNKEHQPLDQQNCVHIVARAFVPAMDREEDNSSANESLPSGPNARLDLLLQAVTESIRCVQQLGTPDVLKMSLHSCPSNGAQQLFIIGRNFDPKGTRILFREYRNDGSLGWSSEATIDRQFLHQCHIVCTVPAYHSLYRSSTVSMTVICGSKQSHPMNFHYIACEREDDDWRPPDCSAGTDGRADSRMMQHSQLPPPSDNYHHHSHQLQQPSHHFAHQQQHHNNGNTGNNQFIPR